MGQSLNVFGADFRTNHLTIVIYWKKRTGIDSLQNGHAALVIDSAQLSPTNAEYYVSWLSSGAKMVNRAEKGTYADDASNWGGNPGALDDGMHLPSRWVALRGMHIGRMKEAWDAVRTKERAHWKMVDKNCATVVARVLKAGGGDSFATTGKKQLVWWPTDLLRYARSMGPNIFRTS